MVEPISDVKVAVAVQGYAAGNSQLSLNRRATVPAVPSLTGTRHGGDGSGRIHAANAVAEGIGNVEVANGV